MLRLKMRLLMLAVTLGVAFSVGASTVGTTATAFAATKGNCTPFLTATASGRGVVKIRWAGASSGWSPPGRLVINAKLFVGGTEESNNSGSKSDATSITLGPFATSLLIGPGVQITVHISATGPAGTVSCQKSVRSP
jgi:hypothetical protein